MLSSFLIPSASHDPNFSIFENILELGSEITSQMIQVFYVYLGLVLKFEGPSEK